jgi:inhibitor of KinA sporulation pathway (predicted exonuclease)
MPTSEKAGVILLDTEFTAWEGSMERGWSGSGEHKEIVQIGAVALDAVSLAEIEAFEVLVKPVKNPLLSDYLVKLTRITNERLAKEGVDFEIAIARFLSFAASRRLHSYGRDDRIIAENAALLGRPELWPGHTAIDLKDWLMRVGIRLAGVHSGDLAAHVGAKAQGIAHDALTDARSLAEAVRYLVARGAPNPFMS